MITKHSINLADITDRCFASTYNENCLLLHVKEKGCGSVRCPFYKPQGCKDWVRIEDRQGINLIPPEEAYVKKRR